jgi:hypothetical protein
LGRFTSTSFDCASDAHKRWATGAAPDLARVRHPRPSPIRLLAVDAFRWWCGVDPAILETRKSSFVLWRPALVEPAPVLVIGRFRDGNPRTLVDRATFPLARDVSRPDFWVIDPRLAGLWTGLCITTGLK